MPPGGLLFLVSSERALLDFDGRYARSLSSQDFRVAFQQGSLVNLEVLNLKICHNLDRDGFNALMKANSKLRHLSLHSLPRVTDYTDIFLECNLQNLEVFFASHCPGFYDRDMDVLKSSCPKMKMHKIIHCGTAYTNCRCFTKEPHVWSLAA
jgi:hypothetical protein